MTVNELITDINIEDNEIIDNTSEYIPYVNAAIGYLSMILVNIKDREVIKNIEVANDTPIPTDFMQLVPKQGYPLLMINGTFKTYGSRTIPSVYYAVRKPLINSLDDTVPFTEFFYQYLIQLVSFLVKKKSLMIDYAGFDKNYIDHLTELIKTSRGA